MPSLLAVVLFAMSAVFATAVPRADAGSAATNTRRPNFLLLIADDLTAEALSCYGARDCKTPNIDRLAARGISFDRAYCQYPVCGPARAALLSGLYPEAAGVIGNGGASDLEEKLGARPTLPEYLRNHDYYTARISKVFHMRVPGDITAGVDGADHEPSWSERFNCRGPEWFTEGPAEHLTNGKLRFDRDAHYNLGFGTAFYAVRGAVGGADQADTIAAEKAATLLTGPLSERSDTPFFLAVGFVRPHVPLVAPEDLFDAYPADELSLAATPADDLDDVPKEGVTMNSAGSGLAGDPDRQRRVLQAYYASVSFMDRQVGRVLDALEDAGLRDTTYVVFLSDHGYHLGEHDLWQKLSLHEESARIPWILAGPGIKPGRTLALVEQIDLYPTLLSLAGIDPPEHLQGINAVPVIRDRRASIRDDVYVKNHRGRMLRTPRYAWMEYEKGGTELYDMDADPAQVTNLADDPALAEVRDRLRARLAARATAALGDPDSAGR